LHPGFECEHHENSTIEPINDQTIFVYSTETG